MSLFGFICLQSVKVMTIFRIQNIFSKKKREADEKEKKRRKEEN